MYLNTNIFHAVSKFPAAGQVLEWTKCPAVRTFHRISTERLFNNFLMIFDVSRNVERFQKLCSFVRRRNNRACAYYEIGICLTLFLHRQLEIFIEHRQKASFEPNEKMRCLFGRNSKNYYGFVLDELSKLVFTIKSR